MYWSIPPPRSAKALEVTGQIELTLYAASSAPDTDFTATLVDVHPGGKAINICEGIVRARFRESYEEPTLIEPDAIYAYKNCTMGDKQPFQGGASNSRRSF